MSPPPTTTPLGRVSTPSITADRICSLCSRKWTTLLATPPSTSDTRLS